MPLGIMQSGENGDAEETRDTIGTVLGKSQGDELLTTSTGVSLRREHKLLPLRRK